MAARAPSMDRLERLAGPASPRRRELIGIVTLAVGLFLGLSLLSYQVGPQGLMGPFGAVVASGLYALLGVGGYAIGAAIAVVAVRVLARRSTRPRVVDALLVTSGGIGAAVLLHVTLGRYRLHGHGPGGLVGEYVGELLRFFLSTAGTLLVATTALLAAVVGLTDWTTLTLAQGALRAAVTAGRTLGELARAAFPTRGEGEGGGDRAARAGAPDEPEGEEEDEEEAAEADDRLLDVETPTPLPPPPLEEETDGGADVAPRIVAPTVKQRLATAVDAAKPDYIPVGEGGYQLPPLSLLDLDEAVAGPPDEAQMRELASRLQRTLETYGVDGRVTEIHPGPVVTMYEFRPADGTRLSKIAGLSGDLAMALEAVKVRIVAPIPGKAAVGIEVPNRQRETVYLKEILGDDCFARARSRITMALGKDIAGLPVAGDLAKMPHLLVAGTTGAGKSVSVNAMICSLLYAATPEEVRMIMVDPKMLELSVYDGIPHLLLPVVTDPKKANLALRWSVDEMDRRYELLSKAKARDIAEYNKKVADGKLDPPAPAEGEPAPPRPRKLPFIVVVIDEFADLMMTAPKEVETSVMRIAQKARAAGIHLLLATQRPSVNVITGVIKANFPSRIAFQVSSKNDSRVILDQGGAENLLGMGDMLYSESGKPLRRVHGCLVTGEEIARIVEFLKQQGKPVYDLDILKPREDEEGDGGFEEDFDDEMYDQAVRVVAETRQASISMLQRRLRVGYNRAARMIERMEKEGIVGPPDGPNRREVLVLPA